ncbi:hypothetical protein K2X30_08545 [bacterium]|jgi:hypothetical protein|nr:hypothetical protein [bacterium]
MADRNYKIRYIQHGISFGTALAICLSYFKNQSILWAIIHGLLSWFYVVYRALMG